MENGIRLAGIIPASAFIVKAHAKSVDTAVRQNTKADITPVRSFTTAYSDANIPSVISEIAPKDKIRMPIA